MNVMDISVDLLSSVSRQEERRSVDTDYHDGKNRAIGIAAYKLCSDLSNVKFNIYIIFSY
jgi:hypothetical protein